MLPRDVVTAADDPLSTLKVLTFLSAVGAYCP